MEGLIPLLIIGAGILYSVFKGNDDNKDADKRNIDKGRLNNPNRPRNTGTSATRTSTSTRDSGRERGLFGDLREELERSFQEFDSERTSNREQNADKGPIERRRAQFEQTRDSGRRIAQDTYQRSRERVETEVDTMRDTIQDRGTQMSGTSVIEAGEFSRPERKTTERQSSDRKSRNQKVAERAQMLRERNRADRVQSDIARVGRTERSVTRETAEQNRYQMDNDFIETGEIGSYEFRINRKTVLDGIIFSEILNKPKSRVR